MPTAAMWPRFFGKRHDNVVRDIRNLVAQKPNLGALNFEAFKIKDLTGESTSHYEMDRDGFALLAMGFTGGKAHQGPAKSFNYPSRL